MFIRASEFLPAVAATMLVFLPYAAPDAAIEVPGVRIMYQDLNLATPAGIAALYQRIRRAAAEYCAHDRIATGTRLSPAYDRCVEDAVAATVQKIGKPGLTALHARHGDDKGS